MRDLIHDALLAELVEIEHCRMRESQISSDVREGLFERAEWSADASILNPRTRHPEIVNFGLEIAACPKVEPDDGSSRHCVDLLGITTFEFVASLPS